MDGRRAGQLVTSILADSFRSSRTRARPTSRVQGVRGRSEIRGTDRGPEARDVERARVLPNRCCHRRRVVFGNISTAPHNVLLQ